MAFRSPCRAVFSTVSRCSVRREETQQQKNGNFADRLRSLMTMQCRERESAYRYTCLKTMHRGFVMCVATCSAFNSQGDSSVHPSDNTNRQTDRVFFQHFFMQSNCALFSAGFMRPPPYFPAPTFPAVGPPPVDSLSCGTMSLEASSSDSNGDGNVVPRVLNSQAPPTILAAVLPGASKDTLLMLRSLSQLLQEYKRQVLPCLLLIIVNLQSSQGRPGEVHAPEVS